ncbi:hypothetical protein DFH05DRAFT_1518729 [Lentinula detonsa]|uniref:Zn(2)-C6 fungal-type domain-containing protein n=1 Tax=Lentinula detonsa TaxID=2804962 RepID=A0A9W8PB79_9AGAR|nr:hypothetical protein DFH05DRAFT_1518729 [Lentinula detonsa]KAJ3989534.1 hypothetical protein F5890DRAFT_1485600 [Lentinula detonsa]
MASRRSSEQVFDDLYPYSDLPFMPFSYNTFGSNHQAMQQTSHPTAVNIHHDSTSSQQQTRHSIYSQELEPNAFAQFLKEDDDLFYATFPDAAKAAAQQQQQQMFILGNDYREFHGSAAFNLSANHGTYAYPSPVSPVHASNVLDVTEGTRGYSGSYATSASSSHAPFPYTLDPSSCGGIPPESGYNHLSESVSVLQDVIQPQPDFAAASFYTQANSEVHSDIPILQHDSIGPLSLPSPTSAKPQMLRLDSPSMTFLRSPSEMTESVFSPMETHHSHMYSLSPEAIIALPPPSPSPTLPLLPSALSPISMMTPPEQLTLPPLPPDPQSDSEPLADDSSGASSSKAVLTKTSFRRKRRRNLSEELQSTSSKTGSSTRSYVYGKIPLPKPTPPSIPKAPKPRPASTSSQSDKKSLALACFFCRGRKIACGPQDPNSADRTCNQCRRRSLVCEYPTESRRGMRKRKSAVLDSSFHVENEHAPKVAISKTTSGSKV